MANLKNIFHMGDSDPYFDGYRRGTETAGTDQPPPPVPDKYRFAITSRRRWREGYIIGCFNALFSDDEASDVAREVLRQLLLEAFHDIEGGAEVRE